MVAVRRKKQTTNRVATEPVPARGWKVHQGWLLRTRNRQGGAESKQKFDTYREAADAARQAAATRQFREVWIEEVGFVPRPWRELDADRRERVVDDRAHVLNVEEDGE